MSEQIKPADRDGPGQRAKLSSFGCDERALKGETVNIRIEEKGGNTATGVLASGVGSE